MTKRSDEGTAPTVRPGDSDTKPELSDPALPISDGLADTAEAPLSGKADARDVHANHIRNVIPWIERPWSSDRPCTRS